MSKNFAVYPSLLEKTVFVTGGALGIGAEIVTAFAKQGSKVGFLDLDLDASKKLAKKLGDNVHFEICDLTNISAMQTSMKNLKKLIGSADILINNAANDDRHDWKDVTENNIRIKK